MADFRVKKSKLIYKGRVIRLTADDVELPSKKVVMMELVHHAGSVAIIPMISKDELFLIRQFRYAAKGYIWEIPAGTLEKGETPLRCAKRELEEELGYRAKNFRKLLQFYPSPGVMDEKIHIFLATELYPSRQKLEIDEILTIKRFEYKDALEMVRCGGIVDGKTIIGLFCAKRNL